MDIQQWIDSGSDYYAGIALYAAQPRHNRNLLSLFTKKKTPATEAKLKYELGKFLKTAPPAKVDQKSASLPKKAKIVKEVAFALSEKEPEPKPKKDPVYMADLPKQLRPVLEAAHALFKQNCRLKMDLNELPDKSEKEAFAIMLQIDDNFKENKLCWQMIDFYNEHGFLPKNEDSFTEMTPEQRVKRQQQKWTAISKANKRIEAYQERLKEKLPIKERVSTELQLKKTKELLLKHELELLDINKLINGNTTPAP